MDLGVSVGMDLGVMAKHGGRLVLLNRDSLIPQKRSPQTATPSSLLSRAMGHPRRKGRMVSSCPSAPESLEQSLNITTCCFLSFPHLVAMGSAVKGCKVMQTSVCASGALSRTPGTAGGSVVTSP